jgi:hypothetical protein
VAAKAIEQPNRRTREHLGARPAAVNGTWPAHESWTAPTSTGAEQENEKPPRASWAGKSETDRAQNRNLETKTRGRSGLGKKNGVRSAHEQDRQTGRAMKSLPRAGGPRFNNGIENARRKPTGEQRNPTRQRTRRAVTKTGLTDQNTQRGRRTQVSTYAGSQNKNSEDWRILAMVITEREICRRPRQNPRAGDQESSRIDATRIFFFTDSSNEESNPAYGLLPIPEQNKTTIWLETATEIKTNKDKGEHRSSRMGETNKNDVKNWDQHKDWTDRHREKISDLGQQRPATQITKRIFSFNTNKNPYHHRVYHPAYLIWLETKNYFWHGKYEMNLDKWQGVSYL